MKDILSARYSRSSGCDTLLLRGNANEETSHMKSLIDGQKKPSKAKRSVLQSNYNARNSGIYIL